MSAVRHAQAVWEGDLLRGTGTVSATSSGLFEDQPISWASRTQRPDGKTSPEELLAAAHASCFAMALAHGLGQAGFSPQRLEVTAQVTLESPAAGSRITQSALTVRGRVLGSDPTQFQAEAAKAKDTCLISQALSGNVELTVEAELI